MAHSSDSGYFHDLPKAPVQKLVRPLAAFLRIEAASGVILLIVTIAALVLANSPVAEQFLAFWKTPVELKVGSFVFAYPLKHIINDGLMVLFFFVVGLEIKREMVFGELRHWKTASLPIVAALGGMVVPAAIYLLFQAGQPAERGWGIPMATDIAFVVGCMAILGPRVPIALRILLLTLAIADDVGAILVIAIGYTSDLHLNMLLWGGAGLILIVILNWSGVRNIGVYFLLGIVIWYCFHESGVHATIAGVILGLMTPVRPWIEQERLDRILSQFITTGTENGAEQRETKLVRRAEFAIRENVSPQERLETALHPWVSFVIMPLFAFANAGISIENADVGNSVALAVLLGLLLGKPIGIFLFSWVAVKVGIAQLPSSLNWKIVFGGGVLAGIGFTMSLFISGLALTDGLLISAKFGILCGSGLSAILGMILLRWMLGKPKGMTRKE